MYMNWPMPDEQPRRIYSTLQSKKILSDSFDIYNSLKNLGAGMFLGTINGKTFLNTFWFNLKSGKKSKGQVV